MMISTINKEYLDGQIESFKEREELSNLNMTVFMTYMELTTDLSMVALKLKLRKV